VLIKVYLNDLGEIKVSLLQIIKQQIEAQPEQSISFYDYMHLALYHPDKGYYSRSKNKIGKSGDFYTSVSVGSIFGEVLANGFAEMIEEQLNHQPCYLVEFGGGTGDLILHILNEWKRNFPHLVDKVNVILIERSPFHRQLQREKLDGFDVQWFETWEDAVKQFGSISGVVYSNELIDAFPVYLLEFHNGEWLEVRVSWDAETEQLVESLREISSPDLLDYIQHEESDIPKINGYRIEVNLDAKKWLTNVSTGLNQGYMVTIDYGYKREDLYLPQRKSGTLLCYHQHIASNNPLEDPGEKDITSHIHFSLLMEKGEELGLSNLGLFTQRQYLMNGGILNKLQEHQETNPLHGANSKRNRAIRQLIMPGGMGDTFKVLVQAKGAVKQELNCLKTKGWI